jgi:hypothetical protein
MLHWIDEQYYPNSGNQFTYVFSFTYLFLIFQCLSPPRYNQQSTHLPLPIFSLSVGGWLMAILFLKIFPSTVRKSECHIFMTLKNPDVLNWILWRRGTELFKTHKTRTMPRKPGWMGSKYVTHFSIMHTKKVPVHTIQSCSTICVTKVVNQTCLI